MKQIRNGSNSGNKFVSRRLLINQGSVIVKSAPSSGVKSERRIEQANNDIHYLNTLSGYPGIPILLAQCALPNNGIEYVVGDINGYPLCHDYYGTDEECLTLVDLKAKIINSGSGMERNLWKFVLNFATLLQMLKNNKLWLEDLSGSNIIVSPNFDVYLVDLDSLRDSKLSVETCSRHADCTSYLNFNLWSTQSLNHKVTCNM